MALAVQVQYWTLKENMRHNRVSEGQEMYNFETNRLNYGVNQQNANVNQQNADTNAYNAQINAINAQTNKVFASAAVRQAGAAETQAQAAMKQAGIAGVNALTNIRNANINATNASTNQRTVKVSEDLMPSQRAKNYAGVVEGVIGGVMTLTGKGAKVLNEGRKFGTPTSNGTQMSIWNMSGNSW